MKISQLFQLSFCFVLTLSGSIQLVYGQAAKKWVAPESANESKNPYKDNEEVIPEAKKLFTAMCVVCHGEQGKGNGAASVAIMPHPANFLSIEVESESDGAIFWKLTNGNPPMASYKTMLTDEQRWKLVTYIRKLEEKDKSHEKKK
jgi:mono/diheme cytochrome c family protein